jgi:PKD repeat protein
MGSWLYPVVRVRRLEVKDVRDKARVVRLFIGLAMLVSVLVLVTACWPFNTAPIASFTASALSGTAPLTVNFSAILSNDPDGIITTYEWDFGDGSSGTGKSASHTYTASGTFTVVLRVTDDDGAQDTAQKTITVLPGGGNGGGGTGPTASFTATPLVGAAPLTVTFNASASSYAGHAITYYSWDFGDGVTGTGMTTSHTYSPSVTTTYHVVLRIIASDNTEGTASKDITVTVSTPTPPSDAPTASFTASPNKQVAPLGIDFDPSNSSASGDRVLDKFLWTFDDGSSAELLETDATVTHYFVTEQASKVFDVTLRVIDDKNDSDTETRSVTVENYQPVAGFEIYYKVNALEATVKADTNADHWIADDVDFTAADGVQSGSNTVWIRSQQITDATWTRTTSDPTPATKTGHPSSPTWASNNYSYDPEGQYWSAGIPPTFPSGGTNQAWGIKSLEVVWGDGTWDLYAYSPTGNLDNVQGNTYAGTGQFTIKLTAKDYLNGDGTFSRKITLND